jgi:2-furoyl-CoA dehydrogenase large subunit
MLANQGGGSVVESTPWVGRPLKRKEDLRFIRGQGEYVDDRDFPGALHVIPIRSPYAHARILKITVDGALAMPGVHGVITGADIRDKIKATGSALPAPYDAIWSYPLAVDKVRFVGEPVAVVVADSPYAALDGAGQVRVEYEAMIPVVDPMISQRSTAPLIHENLPSNLVWDRTFSYGDVAGAFAQADLVVRRDLHLHRFTSAPLETRAAVVSYNRRTHEFAIFSNLQSPERFRGRIADMLGISPEQLHIQAPDIGGGFGLKLHLHWVALLCHLAVQFDRPMKWIEDRTGHLLASHHGNEVLYDAEMAVNRDGTILGVRALAVHDEGAYLEREPKGAVNQLRHATSLYRFQNLEMHFQAVLTNKCPTGPNRSYGKVQQAFLIERLIDEAAREIGMDPAEMRRRNLVQPEQMPYETPTGAIYDGGDYPAILQQALAMFDYAGFQKRQALARQQGRYLGCGIAAGIEASPSSAAMGHLINPDAADSGDSEAALVRINSDGGATVALGSVPQGHGHETVGAQIVADMLGLTPDDVTVTVGYDSWRDPATPFSGTHASRFAVMGVGAIVGAAKRLQEKLLRLGAHVLETQPENLRLQGGTVRDEQTGRLISYRELAHLASQMLHRLPPGMEPGLEARHIYHPPLLPSPDGQRGNFSIAYAYSVTIVSVEVDIETGRVKVDRVVCLDDCGRRLNPLIVEGMIHGAIAHQVGAALFEAIRYDEQGQNLTATFKDYLTPTAADLPSFEVGHFETPSLFSPLGARGAAEGAGTPLVATVNAVANCLAPFGVRLSEGHITPNEVRELLRTAQLSTKN